jgi:hypothetical protein
MFGIQSDVSSPSRDSKDFFSYMRYKEKQINEIPIAVGNYSKYMPPKGVRTAAVRLKNLNDLLKTISTSTYAKTMGSYFITFFIVSVVTLLTLGLIVVMKLPDSVRVTLQNILTSIWNNTVIRLYNALRGKAS